MKITIFRAAYLTRIRESISVMIRVASTYKNQLPSLNPTVIVIVAIKFDSCKCNKIAPQILCVCNSMVESKDCLTMHFYAHLFLISF